MSSVHYAHYNFQTVSSHEEYENLYHKYEADTRLIPTVKDKTITFVRDLEIFETISAFFALLLESFYACFVAETLELAEQRNEAWESLYNREWIRIIALDEEPLLVELSKPNMLPDFPLEITSTIMADFNIPMLGLASQVCKLWQVVCGQDNLWKNFFPSYKFPEGIAIKNYCSTRYINSDAQLLEKVVSFVNAFKANQDKTLRFYPCSSGDIVSQKIDSFISLRCLIPGKDTYRHCASSRVTNSRFQQMVYESHIFGHTAPRIYDQVLFISNIPLDEKSKRPVYEEGKIIKECTFSNIPKVLQEGFQLDYYIMQHLDQL